MSDSVRVQHSQPIPIDNHNTRRRSPDRDSDADASPASPFPLTTPPALPLPINPRVANPGASPTSPILSYFLSQSPTKTATATTFPFRTRGFGSAVGEDDEDADGPAAPLGHHVRRASTAYTGRFPQQPSTFVPPSTDSRGAGVLRRLSLSGAFARPNLPGPTTPTAMSVPPPTPATPVAPIVAEPSPRRKGRSQTMNAGARRAPSPMGERILKGHFDGFN